MKAFVKSKSTYILLFLALLTGGLIFKDYNNKNASQVDIPMHVSQMGNDEKSEKYPKAKEIVNPSGFLNTEPITINQLVGEKVILLDFWTYSCINCQRTIPYLREWNDKYSDKGLVIIGIHTPEFEFEKDKENIKDAMERFGVTWPVVMDNDYGTWRAYKNRYWPRKYLIDIDGYVVYDHIGEGGYETTEMKIQELLQERSRRLNEKTEIDTHISVPTDVENVDFGAIKSPETYFGYVRNDYLADKNALGQSGVFELQSSRDPLPNTLYLDGTWEFHEEYATNLSEGKITYSFEARKVFLVASANKETKAKILFNGEVVDEIKGTDVSDDGTIVFQDERLYRLIESNSLEKGILEIVIDSPGLEVFAFTFG